MDHRTNLKIPKLRFKKMGFKKECVNWFDFAYSILRLKINSEYVGNVYKPKTMRPNPLSNETKILANHLIRVGRWLRATPPTLMKLKEDRADFMFGSSMDHCMYVASISAQKVDFVSYFKRADDESNDVEITNVLSWLYADKESVARIMDHAARMQSGDRNLSVFSFAIQFGFDAFSDFE